MYKLLIVALLCLFCHYCGFCSGIEQEKEDRFQDAKEKVRKALYEGLKDV